MSYPSDYLYTDDHEWLKVEDDVVTLGITDYAQSELGEVVYVDLPEVGDTYDAGDEIGSIESVKAVAEIFTPVAGEVVEVNEELEDAPETVNEDPHETGWICKVKLSGEIDRSGLMDAEAYAEHVQGDA